MALQKTIKTDLSLISGTSNSFFTGVDDEVNLFLDPYVSGYAFIYWLSLPSWFEKDDDLKYFKELTQKNFRSFQGVNSIELNSLTHQTGFAGNEVNIVGDIQKNNTDFTISHKEFSGGVMRKMYQKWISYMRDPRTGIALYPKLFDVDYGARNHTGKLMYIVTRPDVTNTNKEIVEYAAMYSNVFPTNIPLDTLYNWELGNQDSPTIDINFKGFCEIGPDVEAYAKKILTERIMDQNGDSYIPFVDSLNTLDEASQFVAWGSDEGNLGNVYAPDKK